MSEEQSSQPAVPSEPAVAQNVEQVAEKAVSASINEVAQKQEVTNQVQVQSPESQKVDPPQTNDSKVTSSPLADAPAESVQNNSEAAPESAAPDLNPEVEEELEQQFGKPMDAKTADESVYDQMDKANEFLKQIPGKFRLF